MPIPTTCKLCQAFAASQFPTSAERGIPGSDTFTRDPDICDACLSQNYGRRRFSVIEAFCLLLGFVLALVAAGALVAGGIAPVAASRALSLVVLAVAGTPVFAAVVWLALHLTARARVGPDTSTSAERAADAERFYWLAVAASLTGRRSYKRRMLKKALSMGFNDRLRLADPRLKQGA